MYSYMILSIHAILKAILKGKQEATLWVQDLMMLVSLLPVRYKDQ